MRKIANSVGLPLNIVKNYNDNQNNVMEVLCGKWYNHNVWITTYIEGINSRTKDNKEGCYVKECKA